VRPGAISRRQFALGVGALGVSAATGLGLLAGCGRLPWQAPSPPKVPRVGYLAPGPDLGPDDAFRQGLRDLGYVEGQNVVVEQRSAEGRLERVPDFAAELVQLPVDVIVAPSTPDVLAAKRATSTIPIVFIFAADPVGLGLVDSLAHPGGHITGLSNLVAVLAPKRLELLKETVPQAVRVVCLYDPADPSSVAALSAMTNAAPVLGVAIEPLGVQTVDDLDRAFEETSRRSADALITAGGPLLAIHDLRIADFAARSRLPVMYHNRPVIGAGGLMYYGTNPTALYRRAAYYVDRILKGANPADLPIEQPMTFEFVVNLKTARELGITFSNEIMLQVTEVIE
jgi:putative ABC transport system substrate-binding protein